MANNYDLSDLAVPESPADQNYDLSDLVAEPVEEEAPERSMLQNVASVGKGAAAGALGAIPDTLSMLYNLPTQETSYQPSNLTPEEMEEFSRTTGRSPAPPANLPQIPSVTEAVGRGIDTLTGGYTETPEEGLTKHLTEGAKFAGSLALPGGLAKTAAKMGQTGAAKALGAIGTTTAPELAGAAGAGAAMSKLQEEGAGLPAALLGGIGAGAAGTAGLKALKGAKNLTKEAIPQILSIGAKPDEQMIQNAKKFGIEPPSHVQLNSKLSSFLNNSYLKSIFSSQKYQDSIKAADQKMIDTVVNKINTVDPKALEKEVVSKSYREALSEEAKQVEKQANELYENARTYLKPEDKVKPSHTLNMIKDLKSKLSAAVPSSDMKFVLKRLSELSSEWGLAPKGLKKVEKQYEHAPDVLQAYLKTLKTTAPEVPLDQLIQQRSAFMRDIKYGEEARGAKGFMNALISSLDKDIAASSNKEFINNWREANKFYKNEVADRIRTDFAESLTKKEIPKEAYSYMSSPQHIHELERMLGTSPATKQVMNSLKRSKLQEIVLDRITNTAGTMSYANLANLFNKKSTQQGMLKSLLGDKNYKDLSEVAQIAANYNKVGKEFANPSGSALTKQDFDRIGGMMKNILSIGPVGPYAISKIVSNPKYIEKALEYAKARAQNKLPQAQKHQREMKQIYVRSILPSIREGQKHEGKKAEE